MNQEQIDVLNITQQVLRNLVVSLIALNPERASQVGSLLQAAAVESHTEPMASKMLQDLADGVNGVLSRITTQH